MGGGGKGLVLAYDSVEKVAVPTIDAITKNKKLKSTILYLCNDFIIVFYVSNNINTIIKYR